MTLPGYNENKSINPMTPNNLINTRTISCTNDIFIKVLALIIKLTDIVYA